MNTANKFGHAWLGAVLMTLGLATMHAQTTATWMGPASGGEWNTGANWDTGAPPLDVTTNAFIGRTTNVNYNLPMVAAGFGGLTNSGILNINTNGFNCAGITMTNNISRLFVNNFGVVNVTGNTLLLSNAVVSLAAGSSLTIGGTLTFGGSVSGTAFGIVTNNGGTLTAAGVSLNPNNSSIGTSSRLVILGGTNNLGAYSAQRSPGGASAPPALGTDGLVISNGFVNTTSIALGNNAHGIIFLVNGTFTNTGTCTIRNATTTRPARFLQTGGWFVTPEPNLVVMNPSGIADVVYSVLGGTNMVGGFRFGNIGSTNTGVVNFTNAAVVYVGSAGIATNGANNAIGALAITNNIFLNPGGRFGASADWTNAAPIALNGGSFDAQDAAGTPHNIYSSGLLRGSGAFALIKSGGGRLTLGGVNTYLGNTLIQQGALALDAAGSLATSGTIVVGTNALFDVSAVSGGYVQAATKTLGGWGVVTGDVSVAATGIIDPGTNSAPGTLTFSNSVTQTGGAKNHFDLSASPSGPNNDLIVIQGDLNVSGTNLVEIIGGGPSGSVHPLFKYFGNFNGDLTNFSIAGPTGVLTNDTSSTPKLIAFIAATTVRSPTNLVWAGNPTANDWDTLNLTNWLNNGVLDFFVAGDQVLFDSTGAANTNVNIPGSVLPGSTTVNATADYVFAGAGGIGGSGGITKTNSGRLTILTTNQFTSGVSIKGGTLSVESLADDGTDSPLGKTGTILVDGGTLEYSGPNSTWTRGVTLGSTGGAMSVSNATTVLTQGGALGGTGALTKSGAGTLTLNTANSYGGGTLLNEGTLTINNVSGASSGLITLNGGTLAIGAVKPANTINVAASGSISGGNGGGLTGIRNVTGSAPLGLSVTVGVFDLTGDMTAYSGTITLTNAGGASVRFQGTTGSQLATWDLGAGPMDLMIRNSSALSHFGALKGAVGTTLSGRGGASNNGPTTHSLGANGQNTTFDGIIQNGSGGGASITSVTKVGGGTLTLSGVNTYTGVTTISNGVLALTGSASLASSSINLIAGAFLDVSGLGTPTLFLGVSQTLKGNGTLLGGFDTSVGGTVSPGASIGTLTVTNAITLGGTAIMEINRAGAPNSDKLVSSLAGITYGGTLLVTNIGGALQVGDTFTLFSGTSLSGTFGTLLLPNYYTWDTSQLTVNGTISVTAIAAPPTLTADFSAFAGGTITLNAANGAPGGPLTILTSTNVALPLSSWTLVSTGNFDGSGNFSVPVTVDPAAPQQYFIIRAQ